MRSWAHLPVSLIGPWDKLDGMEGGMEDGERTVVWDGVETNKPGVSPIAEYPKAIDLFFVS